MPLDFSRVPQRPLARDRTPGNCISKSDTCNRGRRAASESTSHGNFIFHRETNGGKVDVLAPSRKAHRTKNQILLRRFRERSAAADAARSRKSAGARAYQRSGSGREIELEREAETIETGSKVGRRSGHANFERPLPRRCHRSLRLLRSRTLRIAFLVAATCTGALANDPRIGCDASLAVPGLPPRASVPR